MGPQEDDIVVGPLPTETAAAHRAGPVALDASQPADGVVAPARALPVGAAAAADADGGASVAPPPGKRQKSDSLRLGMHMLGKLDGATGERADEAPRWLLLAGTLCAREPQWLDPLLTQ